MKKVLVAAAVATLALTACGGAEEPVQPPMTLSVVCKTVSGWPGPDGETPKPAKPETATLRDLQEGDEVTIGILTGELTIKVKKVDGDDAKFRMSDALAPRVDGRGYDLNNPKRSFRLSRGETAEFSTPTMDVSTGCKFTLE
uniref:hypothetical protein n=1 Tax=Tessaracoccus timonensis TaxID=2161816 RepID=UPI00131F0210|nr:hypothetical protein [Tessaracoccus timonensis]